MTFKIINQAGLEKSSHGLSWSSEVVSKGLRFKKDSAELYVSQNFGRDSLEK